MSKDEWIKRAEDELERQSPGWDKQALWDYADSLHDTYVTDALGVGYDNDPEGAVVEDMTYWD